MTKLDAAEFLGVSKRAIERYTKADKLHVSYDDHNRAIYDAAEVKALKRQMEQPAPEALVKRDTSITKASRSLTNITGLIAPIIAESVTAAIAAQQEPLADISHKLTLSLAEAARIAGLSKSFLTDAIHTGKLKAAKRGRGWNIKQADLESYIKKL